MLFINKKIFSGLGVALMLLAIPVPEQVAAKAPKVSGTAEADPRVVRLQEYLESKDSPMANDADTFVEVADKYKLDWRFLPAIAGMESSFGNRIPEGSYNPFGWGGSNLFYFDSWEDAIETVGERLYVRVVSKYGTPTPESLGPSYCPPNYKNWIKGVNFFMEEIGEVNAIQKA